MSAVKLANFLMCTVFGEIPFKCWECFSWKARGRLPLSFLSALRKWVKKSLTNFDPCATVFWQIWEVPETNFVSSARDLLVSVEGEVEAWWRHQEGDELVNRSYRNRAADELDHRDVTSNHSRSGGSRGRVRECRLSLSDLALVWVWNSCIDRIVYHFLTDWLFLIKRAFHFATKVNSRDIPKCICFFSALVPSIVVKHDSLWNLAEELQFWQQDLPTSFSLLSELKERQFLWKQYTPTLQLPGNLIG